MVTSFKRPENGSFKKFKQGDIILYISPSLKARGPVTIDVDGFWMLKRIVVIGDFVA